MSGTSWLSCRLVREPAPERYHRKLNGPGDVAEIVHELTHDLPGEAFVIVTLNTQHWITGVEIVTRGVLDGSLIHPRDVFRSAILANAAALIIAHNHPSGDLTPSAEDRKITRMMKDAGKLLCIPVLDSLIVTHEGKFHSIEGRVSGSILKETV